MEETEEGAGGQGRRRWGVGKDLVVVVVERDGCCTWKGHMERWMVECRRK